MRPTPIPDIRLAADALLTDVDVTALLGLKSEVTLRSWRSQKRGPPFVKVEGAVRYQRSAINEYLKRRTVLPTKSKAV
jgi:predicted DNA-binding transcriptional regulator AlpA